MSANPPAIRIALIGTDIYANQRSTGCCLWTAGYAAAIQAAEAEPLPMGLPRNDESWEDYLENMDGVVFLGSENSYQRPPIEERLCEWCYEHAMPLLCIDNGMLILNQSFGGTIFSDLCRDLPNSLQHRHPPERGLRHAINIEPNTKLAEIYGEGEIVVNSEHRRGLDRLARGFRVGARALDGVVEGIESESERWFALGVQWQPGSTSASGLDIQVFRALVTAARQRIRETSEVTLTTVAA